MFWSGRLLLHDETWVVKSSWKCLICLQGKIKNTEVLSFTVVWHYRRKRNCCLGKLWQVCQLHTNFYCEGISRSSQGFVKKTQLKYCFVSFSDHILLLIEQIKKKDKKTQNPKIRKEINEKTNMKKLIENSLHFRVVYMINKICL